MNFFTAWMNFCLWPLRLQSAVVNSTIAASSSLAVDTMKGSFEMTSSLTFGAPRRRSTAKLTLAASNNWARSHRSTARLTLVSSR